MISKIFRFLNEPPILTEEDLKSFQLAQFPYRQTSATSLPNSSTEQSQIVKPNQGEHYEIKAI